MDIDILVEIFFVNFMCIYKPVEIIFIIFMCINILVEKSFLSVFLSFTGNGSESKSCFLFMITAAYFMVGEYKNDLNIARKSNAYIT